MLMTIGLNRIHGCQRIDIGFIRIPLPINFNFPATNGNKGVLPNDFLFPISSNNHGIGMIHFFFDIKVNRTRNRMKCFLNNFIGQMAFAG